MNILMTRHPIFRLRSLISARTESGSWQQLILTGIAPLPALSMTAFPEHLRSGAAIIRWCRPLRNNNGYQAGLSFRDDRIFYGPEHQ